MYYNVLLTMETITLRVDSDFAKEIELAMKPLYSTKTEFIREAIRDKVKEIKREQMTTRKQSVRT